MASMKKEESPEPSSAAANISNFKGTLKQYGFGPRSDQVSNSTGQSTSVSTSTKRPASKMNGPLSPSPSLIKKSKTASSVSTFHKSKRSSGYAPPSTYAHIVNNLTDSIAPNLICMFVGLNPGIRTATSGHAYAHPSNLFWRLVHSSGCTPRLCRPAEDGDMPRLYQLGLTNIVPRPTREGSELSKEEMDDLVKELEAKIALYRPESVAIVGKSIWESIWRVKNGKAIRKEQFKYGWQDDRMKMGKVKDGEEKWAGARVFVATTTSGLAAGMKLSEKEEIWRGLGEWVEKRRSERAELTPELNAAVKDEEQ
ncbi:hypothetical protein MMC07_006778 [Pseudocyphellaria aurata]|nr:hypothetical protein [Pseudocyphellaria aurata]